MGVDIDKPISDMMVSIRAYFGNDYLFALVIVVAFFVLALIITFIYSSVLRRLCTKTNTQMDDMFINATKRPLIMFITLIGIETTIVALEMEGTLVIGINDILSSALIILFAYMLIRSLDLFVIRWGMSWLQRTHSQYSDTILPLIQKLINALIIVAAIIAILSVWGIEVRPFLAGLGIAGLAVGLALQDSLKDLISGISLIIDRTYKVGDKVKLDSGEIGDIHEITLRSTRIRTYNNNVIIIPNAKMASSKIINYTQPSFNERGQVPFDVVYGSDITRTKEAALAAVKAVPEVLATPAPSIEFLDLADYSLKFRALFWVSMYGEKWKVERAVVQGIYEALNAAGIEFAFPTSTIHLEKGE